MAAPVDVKNDEILDKVEGILAAAGHSMSDAGRADVAAMLSGQLTEDEVVQRMIARATAR